MWCNSMNNKDLTSCFNVFRKVGSALSSVKIFQNICFKPKQLQCFEALLDGRDVVAVLPTGYGKSLIFQLLPWVLTQRSPTKENIVIVVSPLSSIIEDQISVLSEMGVKVSMLPNSWFESKHSGDLTSLFPTKKDNNHKENSFRSCFLQPEFSILFAHPESLLSENGRKLLKSAEFQARVVACAIDEAHCIETWGNDFRMDFSKLAVLRSLIPNIRFVAVTATCTKINIKKIVMALVMKKFEIIHCNPNRPNIFLSVKRRNPTIQGFRGTLEILEPIARNLRYLREKHPVTVIYMKLDFCGNAYTFFERMLGDSQYVGESKNPEARLFNQFHAPATKKMKKSVLREIKSNNSRTRVLFATTALGMGVDARNIENVIHIGPPPSIEAYVQEFGRAGRSKNLSWATLYFNNSDIASNTHIEEEMRKYCLNTDCAREFLIKYFGFNPIKQDRCCFVCQPNVEIPFQDVIPPHRVLLETVNIDILKSLLKIL